MTRFEAMNAIYSVINSGILDEELKDTLVEVVNCICGDDFEKCPAECLLRCKLDECLNTEKAPDEDYDEDEKEGENGCVFVPF